MHRAVQGSNRSSWISDFGRSLMLGPIVFAFALLAYDGRAAVADDMQRAIRAFYMRDYATAGVLLLELAREGEVGACLLLAKSYEIGTGRPQDLYEALYWVRKSGSMRAIERIRGRGISLPLSDEEVAALYLRQAAQGDIAGSYRAALVTETGRGVEPDDAKAFKFYLRAALGGHPYARYEVAGRYFEGRGVEKDHVKAALWMKKASEQGLAIARHLRADFLIAGVGTTPDSAAAMALYKSGAEDNYARSQMVYGGMLLKLAQSREERIESVKWLMLAMPSLEPSLARRVVRALKSPANPVKDPSEVQEAKARAKAFVISRQ